MALVSALGAERNYQWCMSPACKSGQIHEDAEAGPIMTCNHCGFRSCVLHQVPFHEGETCSQYDDRMNRLRDGLHGKQQAKPEPSERSPVTGGKRKRGYAEPEDAEPRVNQGGASSQEMSSAISLMNLGPKSTPGGKRQRLQEQRPEEQRQAEEQKRAKEKLKEEMASQNTLKLYRRCPGENCGYMVEKTGGCDHITCKITQDTARSTHQSSEYLLVSLHHRQQMQNGVLLPLRRPVRPHPSRRQCGTCQELSPLSSGRSWAHCGSLARRDSQAQSGGQDPCGRLGQP